MLAALLLSAPLSGTACGCCVCRCLERMMMCHQRNLFLQPHSFSLSPLGRPSGSKHWPSLESHSYSSCSSLCSAHRRAGIERHVRCFNACARLWSPRALSPSMSGPALAGRSSGTTAQEAVGRCGLMDQQAAVTGAGVRAQLGGFARMTKKPVEEHEIATLGIVPGVQGQDMPSH